MINPEFRISPVVKQFANAFKLFLFRSGTFFNSSKGTSGTKAGTQGSGLDENGNLLNKQGTANDFTGTSGSNSEFQKPLSNSNKNSDDSPSSSMNPGNEDPNDFKSKLKIITSKLQNTKKEKEVLQKENKSLQEEILALQSNLRQMIPGFSNTSSSFPMLNELATQTADFYKYDCVDIFFDILCPELNMKGIIYFYNTSFTKLQELVANYFSPMETAIKKTGGLDNIEGPIMNVLRKSFQNNYKEIFKKCLTPTAVKGVLDEIQANLKLGDNSEDMNKQIQSFLQKMGEIFLCYFICDPPLYSNYKAIGTKVLFNNLKHDPLDGFVKPKEECIVILPSLHKSSSEGEIITKALVLQVNYEIPN
jgi:hypothetical protein